MRKEVHTKQKILQEYYKRNDAPLAHFFESIWSLLLHRVQRKLKNLEWSKDVLQEVILNFLSYSPEVRPTKLKPDIENLIGFFIRVVECEAINALQKKINRDRHIGQMLKQFYRPAKYSYILSEEFVFQTFKEDERELFIQKVKSVLEQRAERKKTAIIDVDVYELMLLFQSRDIAHRLSLPIEKVEVIKKRVRRVMKKVRADTF